MSPELSIVIVNYNVKYFLEQCIQSILDSKTKRSYEIIVVDNQSSDGSVERIRHLFPEIKLIENEENVGFSKANNIGFKQASGEYILILNPDTVLQENTIEKSLEFYEKTDHIGALGVRMIDGSGQFLRESKRGFPSPWTSFCKISGIYRFFPNSRFFNSYYQGHINEMQTAPVDILTGAFMLVRKDILDQAGGFDEDYFMYGEDIDLSYTIAELGYQNYYYPETTIIHYKGESTKKGSLNYVKVFYQAMIIFAKKHLGKQSSAWFVAFLQLAIYFRGALTLVSNVFSRIWLPAAEVALMFAGTISFQAFWARFYFDNPAYYENSPLLLNLMIYAVLFLLSMFLHGAYDQPLNMKKIRKGFSSTILLFAIWYALVDLEYRTSRVILIATVLIAVASSLLVRSFYKWFKYGQSNLFRSMRKRMAIVGSSDEFDRALKLFKPLNIPAEILGRISPGEEKSTEALGQSNDLKDIISAYKLNSLIFCSADLSSEKIMQWMTDLGDRIEFKMLPEKSSGIIGSHSKDLQGELYTVELQYDIRQPENRRAKMFLDRISAFLFLILLIPLLPFSQRLRKIWGHCPAVLLGRNTWITYAHPADTSLPKLKDGLWSPLVPNRRLSGDIKILNFQYARDYRWTRDLELIIKNIWA